VQQSQFQKQIPLKQYSEFEGQWMAHVQKGVEILPTIAIG